MNAALIGAFAINALFAILAVVERVVERFRPEWVWGTDDE